MNFVAGGALTRLRASFPDREFIMRSQGQVRFIKITARGQMIAASIVLAALLAWGLSLAVMGWLQYQAAAERLSLLEREATVAQAEERVGAYRQDIGAVASDLEKRQAFIEEMVDSLPADARGGVTVTDSAGEADKTVAKVSALIPEAGALARIEARQLAFVERLTRYADRRAERTSRAIRQLGLDPNAMVRAAGRSAMGGPLQRLSTSSDGSIDPRFQRLGASLARMEALDRSLAGIPQYRPANVEMLTSSYGMRRDPFTGEAAMHSGLDFRGPLGAPIYAAAKGRVSFVGQKQGYGNVVEIAHGNGMVTRYAHMSAFRSRVGQDVSPGDVIGAIGSTGRSTGPHLHFEVRVNDRAVNPRPFLEAAPHVLKEARRVQSDEPARG
ncbi:M23 family metallopeptidase [Altererythrobacter sp. TH136]|uniref:M23 family metallopeptidase n=1 Tax=Altererythrobacter sp. TH136 TaxID=2067415 RepID=UPI001164645F|nr:M23 family metallopeptidase [Altererythrobacter sp. TH136]QDM41037.1 M23 family metallopeptidase [Altererythrobacter sp. TH136]